MSSNSFPQRGTPSEPRVLESKLRAVAENGASEKGGVAMKEPPGAKSPPSEQFWQKFSPHYEFPLSNIASVAMHVIALVIAIYMTTRLMKKEELPPVPVSGQRIAVNPGSNEGAAGSGGGMETRKEAVENDTPAERRHVEQVDLAQEIPNAVRLVPDLQNDPIALEKFVKSPNYDDLKKTNKDLQDRIKKGFRKGGAGTSDGDGASNAPGPGPGGGKEGRGDGTKSGERSMRWTIIFKTTSGAHYLQQLNAFKAKVVVPEPPDWKTNRLFENILDREPGKILKAQELPEMYFTDSDKNSASKVARALGLDYDPPYFIAFFPKDVENELAAKERSYRNKQEKDIYSTTFRVIERNGDFIITVTDQTPMKR